MRMKLDRYEWWLIGAGLFFYAMWAGPLIWHGPYNPDEGWYLYDAWLTWHGHIPYVDFAFPQPPLILLVHGFFQTVFGPGFFLGRIVNAVIGGLTLTVSVLLAKRYFGLVAALFTLSLLSVAPWFALQMVSVSTYALASLWLVGTLWAVLTKRYALAGCFVVAAVWTRLTLVGFVPMLLLLPFWLEPTARAWQIVWRMLKGIGLMLVVGVLPFFLMSGKRVYVDIVGYHTYTRQALLNHGPGWQNVADFMQGIGLYVRSAWLPTYGIYYLLAAVAVIIVLVKVGKKSLLRRQELIAVVFLVAGGLTGLAHLWAQNLTYDVPLIPLLVLLGAGVASRNFFGGVLTKEKKGLVLICIVGLVAWQVHSQMSAYTGRDDNEESTAHVMRVVRYIQAHSQASDVVFTPELYIPLEAHRLAVPGTELGRFFFFPEFSDEAAREHGVLNEHLLTEIVTSRQPKFVVINQAHWLEHTREGKQWFYDALKAAGYGPVDDLNVWQPAIESLRVYVRN